MRQLTPKLEQLFRVLGIPKRYWGLELSDLDNSLPQAYKRIKTYMDNIHKNLMDGVGLYLYGQVGSGKTSVATIVLQELAYQRVVPGQFVRMPDLLNWYLNEKPLFKRVLARRVLAIDDLGNEYRTNTEFVSSMLEELLRYRVDNKRTTLITSNYSLDGLADKYSLVIPSLILGSSLVLSFEGHDFRLLKQKQLQSRLRGE